MTATDPKATLPTSAEVHDRRLYLDGQPFPYATSASIDLQVIRTEGLTTIMVPLVVHGPVTVGQKLYGHHQGAHTDLPSVACNEAGEPVKVFVDGRWRSLTDDEES